MRYLISKNREPLLYISSGKYIGKNFINSKRRLDSFVMYVCIRGTVYIAQDGYRFTLRENQYLILFADHEHTGYKESETKSSFYWCHFTIAHNDYRIVNKPDLSDLFGSPAAAYDMPQLPYSDYYILPEHGDISPSDRAILIFRQLLDISRRNHYSDKLPNYTLSLLAMEITQEYVEHNLAGVNQIINPGMEKVIEWVRINYNLNLPLAKIAKALNYNPDYLSTTFRKYKGIPLMKYITTVRIAKAKELLLNSSDSIKVIAFQTGFSDDKAFMKRFKLMEDITPTKYRNAFSRVKINKA